MPAGPRLVWAIDIITDLGIPPHCAMAVCCYCKFKFLEALDDRKAKTLTSFLWRIIATFGVPIQVRTDNGPEFGGDFHALCLAYKIEHRQGPPYHSRGNGQVERSNRSVESLLRRALLAHVYLSKHWARYLPAI